MRTENHISTHSILPPHPPPSAPGKNCGDKWDVSALRVAASPIRCSAGLEVLTQCVPVHWSNHLH